MEGYIRAAAETAGKAGMSAAFRTKIDSYLHQAAQVLTSKYEYRTKVSTAT